MTAHAQAADLQRLIAEAKCSPMLQLSGFAPLVDAVVAYLQATEARLARLERARAHEPL